jgi:glycosyltransferase involved in cell wall biosynthesis
MMPHITKDASLSLDASVVIPTHNRAASLVRVLRALEEQTYDMSRVEVIVVADGCTDETVSMLNNGTWGLKLTVIDQPQSGVAVTRNHGAEAAQGKLLIFLDDDVRPAPDCIDAHIEAQHEGPTVSIGHLSADPEGNPPGWWRWMEWQLEKQYSEMLDGSRPIDGLALYSGNFSVPRDLFAEVEGFNTELKACEDTDLGIRLQMTGARFNLNMGAVGWHSGYHSYSAWKGIAHKDGLWDAEEALKLAYPFGWRELLNGYHERHPLVKAAARRLLDRKTLFPMSIAALKIGATLASFLRLRGPERFIYGGIYALLYWQAVSDGVGGSALLWRYLDADETSFAEAHA